MHIKYLKGRKMEVQNEDVLDYGSNKLILSNGVRMPLLGLGTYRVDNIEDLHLAIDTALAEGYRLFDTAAVYGNEQAIGNSIRHLMPKYGLRREDIFITSKLAPSDMGSQKAPIGIEKCLNNLGMEYVDLFLINYPAKKVKSNDPNNKTLRIETWQALIDMYTAGKARAIGVSNFTIRHLMEVGESSGIHPMVNQIEWHPYNFDPDLQSYCQARDIALQAYSSFGGLSSGDPSLIEEAIVKNLALRYCITPAQVLLQWAVQREIAVIPKSVTTLRIQINYHLNIEMMSQDLVRLDSLNKYKKYAWDPEDVL